MPVPALPAVSLLFAAALGLVNVWLAIRASAARIQRNVMVGDGDDPVLRARMRAHANFTEYVPSALILMTLIELMGGRGTALWAIGSLLVVGRVLHPFGMERPAPNPFRMAGIALTMAATIALIGWAVWILLHPPAGAAAVF